jgi:hypothetical protein
MRFHVGQKVRVRPDLEYRDYLPIECPGEIC